MIDTDEHFSYLDIERHSKTRDLHNLFISSGFLQTVILPTLISHNTSALIDNIYIKCKCYDEFVSRMISVDISDHFLLFNFVRQIDHTKLLPKKEHIEQYMTTI